MRKITRFILISLWTLFHFTNLVPGARSGVIAAQILHPSLGQVIDAQENLRYNIFGDITGFAAASIYQLEVSKYQLHLLRNFEDRAQILILGLPVIQLTQLRTKVENRVKVGLEKEIRFDPVLYPVAESRWAEVNEIKKLTLQDGSELFVTLQKAQLDTLIVRTLGGIEVKIPDNQIASVHQTQRQLGEAGFIRTDPNTSRLFFAPTGHRLNAGTGYFADYFIFFPTIAYALTDFFSVSGGVSILPGAESQVLYFAPKLTWQVSPKVGLGTGFLYLAIPEGDGEDDQEDINLGYAVTTLGNDRSSVTLGTGLSLNSNTDLKTILLLGGETQISNSAKLITENWIFTGDEFTIIFSGGVRFFGDRLAVDLALLTTEDAFGGGGFPFMPWVDFSVFFGK